MKRILPLLICTVLLILNLIPAVYGTSGTTTFQDEMNLPNIDAADYPQKLSDAFIQAPSAFVIRLADLPDADKTAILTILQQRYDSKDAVNFSVYKAAVAALLTDESLSDSAQLIVYQMQAHIDMLDPPDYTAPIDYTLLFQKAMHSDGAYTAMYAGDLYAVFTQEPRTFLTALADTELPKQEHITLMLVQELYFNHPDGIVSGLDDLKHISSLSEAEVTLLSQIEYRLQAMIPAATQPSTTAPTIPSTPITESNASTTPNTENKSSDSYQLYIWLTALVAIAGTILLLVYKRSANLKDSFKPGK